MVLAKMYVFEHCNISGGEGRLHCINCASDLSLDFFGWKVHGLLQWHVEILVD